MKRSSCSLLRERSLSSALAKCVKMPSTSTWGARADGFDSTHRHRACGTPLELRHWCPTCDVPVDDPDADDLTWF